MLLSRADELLLVELLQLERLSDNRLTVRCDWFEDQRARFTVRADKDCHRVGIGDESDEICDLLSGSLDGWSIEHPRELLEGAFDSTDFISPCGEVGHARSQGKLAQELRRDEPLPLTTEDLTSVAAEECERDRGARTDHRGRSTRRAKPQRGLNPVPLPRPHKWTRAGVDEGAIDVVNEAERNIPDALRQPAKLKTLHLVFILEGAD